MTCNVLPKTRWLLSKHWDTKATALTLQSVASVRNA